MRQNGVTREQRIDIVLKKRRDREDTIIRNQLYAKRTTFLQYFAHAVLLCYIFFVIYSPFSGLNPAHIYSHDFHTHLWYLIILGT